MSFEDSLAKLAEKVESNRAMLETEEATKNAMIMPLINALGYNVFDPTEVTPEFTADVGTKKGEKVDYAIRIDGLPMILIECKSIGSELSFNHASQLYRYFGVTDARFAILTNGVDYWIYTDLESPNRMDKRPFFKFNLLDFDSGDAEQLQKFSKSVFDLGNILNNASELKYVNEINNLIKTEFDQPTEDFVRLFVSRTYEGRISASVIEQFTPLVKSAFREFVQNSLSDRLKLVLHGVDHQDITVSDPDGEPDEDNKGIITTAEEIEGFHIVRAILANHIEPSRIVMRDTKSYCGILLDDNNRKPICRLRFNHSQKYVGIFCKDKEETRHPISDITEIYKFSKAFNEVVEAYN